MKKIYAILCLTITSLIQLQAQAPQGFNYQATVRNSTGAEGSEVELFWGGFEFIILILYCNKLHLQT